jgi:hypothetical protein
MMAHETLAKALILTRGVQFTDEALEMAAALGAKGQNLVYNAPRGYRTGQFRPQELLLRGEDGYQTCASAVAPSCDTPVRASVVGGRLTLALEGFESVFAGLSETSFVPQPGYYAKTTRSGVPLTRLVSACGVDEMNVWPWHDCAISKMCTFCGVNKVNSTQREKGVFFTAKGRRERSAQDQWQDWRASYLAELYEAVDLAIDDPCYDEHLHLILISGNLRNDELDTQAHIYADIARGLNARYRARFTEGVVAVTAPPATVDGLQAMKDGGVDIVVFNLEAWMPETFATECPGKHEIGRDHYLHMLREAVRIYGWGRSWCNLVFGLDTLQDSIAGCEELARQGITPSANILHLDEGSRCTKTVPRATDAAVFFRRLAEIYREHGLEPYYCQRALRTSLSNEAYAGRLAPRGGMDPVSLLAGI